MTNRRMLVLGAAAIALIGFSGATYFVSNRRQPSSGGALNETSQLIRPHSPTFGPADAPVTIVEFFDPACEACRAFHPIVKQIMDAFPGKVRVVLRYAAFHGPSAEAISILEAARLQNLFEPVLEMLFEAQSQWAPHGRAGASPWNFVKTTGLDVTRARRDAKLPGIVAILKKDAADITVVGVRRTPTFFVNGKLLTDFGAQQLFDLVKSEVETADRSSANKS